MKIGSKLTMLDFFAFVSTVMIAVIGYLNSMNQGLIISGQTRMADNQEEMRKELSNTNTFMQVHTTQISSLTSDMMEVKTAQKKFQKDILIKVDGVSRRVYKLEGAK